MTRVPSSSPSASARDAQHRAAEVDQHEHAVAGVGLADGGGDAVAVGAERSLGAAAGGQHTHLVPRDLPGHLGETLGRARRVRHQYNPDHERLHRLVFYIVERRSAITTTVRTQLAIQSIERAAAILRALGSGSRRLGVSELSDRLGLAKGTVHGLLQTLQEEGFVEQDAESGKYQLGAALLQLGNIYLDVNELRGRSLAWADNLAIRTGEAVRVGTLHGDGVLIIHHVFRPDNTLQILEVGAQLPLHATALGKALLAHGRSSTTSLLAHGRCRGSRRPRSRRRAARKALEAVRTTAGPPSARRP